MNSSLVPANTKKATLILGIMRPMPDLLIMIVGLATTVILMLALGNAPTWQLLLAALPMLIGLLLILPIPNYHNTLCAIQSILGFYQGRRKYTWKGWCITSEYQKHNK